MSTKTPVNPVTLCAMGTDGKLYPVLLDPASQSLKVETTLEVGDIEIGGVEIKNGADDTRAVVTSGAATPATTDNALVTAVADGKHVAVGAKADAAQTDPTQAASLISLIKGWLTILKDVWDNTNHWLRVMSAPVVLSSATRTDVAASVTVVTLLAANGSRKPGSLVANDSTAILYVKLGAGASSSDFYAAVDGKTTVPGVLQIPDGFTGIVTGVWASATGTARMTEMS